MISDLSVQLRKDINGLFQESLMTTPSLPLMESCATLVKSTSDKEDYSWLDEVQDLNEFEDEVEFTALSQNVTPYEAINIKYTGGLAFNRDDLNDDKVGGMRLRINDLSKRGFMHADVMIADVLTGNPTGLNAEALFSATHAARGSSGQQSNLLTGNGTTTANVATDLSLAIAALYNFLDYAGKPVNRGFRQIFVIYPPALNKQVLEAVEAPIVSQTSNVQFSRLQINPIMEPLLSADSAVDYYVGIQDAPVRGILYQEREGLSFEAQESPESDDAFKREVYNYKVRKRAVAKGGQWRRIVKVNNT